MVDSYCTGCFFRTKVQSFGICCDYLLITGHIRPCCSGEGCTVRLLNQDIGDGSLDVRKELYLRGRKKTEEEEQAARQRKLEAKRAYNREYYQKTRERNLARQKARRERIKAERVPLPPKERTEQMEQWRSGKAKTAAKTKARWQGRQTAAIKGWKAVHGMTYEMMAEKIGVDSTTVMKWANEANNADWALLAKLGIERPEEPAKIEKIA